MSQTDAKKKPEPLLHKRPIFLYERSNDQANDSPYITREAYRKLLIDALCYPKN